MNIEGTDMLNIAFCDDDKTFLHNIEIEAAKIFKTLKVYTSISLFTNADLLIKRLEKYDPYYDIIFLDIDMPVINGKEAARRLRLIDKKFKLVFITSFEHEALNTFQYDVSGFLPKTLLEERLPSVIKRIVNAISEENLRMQIFKVNMPGDRVSTVKIPLDDIIYIESVNRKIYLHTKRETYLLNDCRFMDMVEHYNSLGFVDIHRTCIVNIKYVFSIDDADVHLDDGTVLPLSRRKRQKVLDKYLDRFCEVTKCENC